MKTFRVTTIIEVECSTELEAKVLAKAETPRVFVQDVSELVCCETSRHSNGWRHSGTCKNWVTQF